MARSVRLRCHLNKKEEGRKRGGGEGACLRKRECSHLSDAEETLVVVGMYVHTADLLPTSPRKAQGRKALEGKPGLKVTFNYFFDCL